MKTNFRLLRIASFLLVVIGCLSSCGSDNDSEGNGSTALNKQLIGSKWTSRNWDFDIDVNGEWAYLFDEVYTVYFYSATEGVAYYARKTVDSDEGNSHDRDACFFKYYFDGETIRTETITSPFRGFQSVYTLENGILTGAGYNMRKGTINGNDGVWLNSIRGVTGGCTWYYDYSGGLTIAGEGNMADYKSYEYTPWCNKYHAINEVRILEGVKYIGSRAFASPSIGYVELPKSGLSKIGDYAFEGSSIGTVSLFSVKHLGNGAFSDCKYATVNFYEEIEEIGDFACDGCKYASLSMTPSLRKIGSNAFSGCQVKSWTNSKVLEYIGNAAFTNIKISEVDLPSIKELGHIAFNATSVSKIHIGPYLQKVTGTPFYCASTGTVTIDVNSPLQLNNDFVNPEYAKKWNLVVPTGSEIIYLNAQYWNNFKSVTGGSGTGADDGNVSDGIIHTVDAVPGIFEVKLYGRLGDNVKKGNAYFRVSKSSNFEDCLTTSKLSVADLSDKSYEITLNSSMECGTNYYYQAVYEYSSSNIKYGETKTFTTLRPKCPRNLTYTIKGQTYEMILVSGGPDGDFYIMQTELPHSLDWYVAGEHVSRLDESGEGVIIKKEWRAFIDNLRVKTGIDWRLPTSSEWKYAAKGGNLSKGTTYSGSNTISDVAWYSGNSSKYVHDCALKEPNELGIYDMSGNYAELTFGKDIYDVDGSFYGGCWNDASSACTVTSYKPGSTSGNVPGTKFKEKNAFDGKYTTVRLVYSAE